MRNAPYSGQNIIDSRDIIERIAELTDERDDLQQAYDDAAEVFNGLDEDQQLEDCDEAIAMREAEKALDEWDGAEELATLQAFEEEASGYCSDWLHGEALISDEYFEEYARDLAEDIGAISRDSAWPCTCIDWERAARELRQDYTSAEFDGVTYWFR